MLVKTGPNQQRTLFCLSDTEQKLHCRVPIRAMGEDELLTHFLVCFVCTTDIPLCHEPQMLIRCFSLCGDPPLPTCLHWHLPAVAAGSSLPLSPSKIETHLNLVLSGKAKRV